MGSQVFISPQLGRLAAQAATVAAKREAKKKKEEEEREGAKNHSQTSRGRLANLKYLVQFG